MVKSAQSVESSDPFFWRTCLVQLLVPAMSSARFPMLKVLTIQTSSRGIPSQPYPSSPPPEFPPECLIGLGSTIWRQGMDKLGGETRGARWFLRR